MPEHTDNTHLNKSKSLKGSTLIGQKQQPNPSKDMIPEYADIGVDIDRKATDKINQPDG